MSGYSESSPLPSIRNEDNSSQASTPLPQAGLRGTQRAEALYGEGSFFSGGMDHHAPRALMRSSAFGSPLASGSQLDVQNSTMSYHPMELRMPNRASHLTPTISLMSGGQEDMHSWEAHSPREEHHVRHQQRVDSTGNPSSDDKGNTQGSGRHASSDHHLEDSLPGVSQHEGEEDEGQDGRGRGGEGADGSTPNSGPPPAPLDVTCGPESVIHPTLKTFTFGTRSESQKSLRTVAAPARAVVAEHPCVPVVARLCEVAVVSGATSPRCNSSLRSTNGPQQVEAQTGTTNTSSTSCPTTATTTITSVAPPPFVGGIAPRPIESRAPSGVGPCHVEGTDVRDTSKVEALHSPPLPPSREPSLFGLRPIFFSPPPLLSCSSKILGPSPDPPVAIVPSPPEAIEVDDGSSNTTSSRSSHTNKEDVVVSGDDSKKSDGRPEDSSPLSALSPPPPSAPCSITTSALHNVSPLIQQYNYCKSDIKRIASTSEYTFDVLRSRSVALRVLPEKTLQRLNPARSVHAALVEAGDVAQYWIKEKQKKRHQRHASGGVASTKHKGKDAAATLREITVKQFPPSLVTYDSIALALAVSLWSTVLYHNDLVTAALTYFASLHDNVTVGRESNVDGDAKEDGNGKLMDSREGEEAGSKEAGVSSSSSSTSSSAAWRGGSDSSTGSSASGTMEVSIPALFSWLNREGIDIIVLSADRRAASSFCVKHRYVSRNSLNTSRQQHLKRALVALEYDVEKDLWAPLTLRRPIRAAAAAQHAQRRAERRRQKRRARKEAEAAVRAAVEAKAAATMNRKKEKWMTRLRRYDQVPVFQSAEQVQPRFVMALPGEKADAARAEAQRLELPFASMNYPNTVQTDMGLVPVLRESTHRKLPLTCVKLLLGFPNAFIAVLIGIALIIYVSITLSSCCYSDTLHRCLTSDEAALSLANGHAGGSGSNDGLGCPALVCQTQYQSSLANRFLYGAVVAPGNVLVVVVSMMFCAAIACVLVVFFSTRFMAVGSNRPCFFYIMQLVHVLCSAVACAFAAYALYSLHGHTHRVGCGNLHPADAKVCRARQGACPGIGYGVVERSSPPQVTLALCIVLLVLCAIELAIALLPTLPSAEVLCTLPVAKPDTHAFQPSVYAPDGMSAQQAAELLAEIKPVLSTDLKQQRQVQDSLLTRSATVGEMMQTNVEQSIRMMELSKTSKKRRGFTLRHRSRHGKHLRYMYLQDHEEAAGEGVEAWHVPGGTSSINGSGRAAANSVTHMDSKCYEDNAVVSLPPQVAMRVDRISRHVQARAVNPFTAMDAATTTTTTTTTIAPMTPLRNPTESLGPVATAKRTRKAGSKDSPRPVSRASVCPSTHSKATAVSPTQAACTAKEDGSDPQMNSRSSYGSLASMDVELVWHRSSAGFPSPLDTPAPSSVDTNPSATKPGRIAGYVKIPEILPLPPALPAGAAAVTVAASSDVSICRPPTPLPEGGDGGAQGNPSILITARPRQSRTLNPTTVSGIDRFVTPTPGGGLKKETTAHEISFKPKADAQYVRRTERQVQRVLLEKMGLLDAIAERVRSKWDGDEAEKASRLNAER